eukprot:TRINITY_DN21889_c0_g1_i1.p1 TRINITY_DN21889_c0_g1~~TRINITY_DN21889_c0_g1_i1.p1  ORF type:complete len:263 (+),score=37.30 TRINITY_DN21889_c0_g1_i1:83-871(+)
MALNERSPVRVSHMDNLQIHLEGIHREIAAEKAELTEMRQMLMREREMLDEERRLFEVEKRALRDRLARGSGLVSPLTGNVVELNVGGVQYTTSLTTIMSEPESALARLFRTPSEIPLDGDGRFFLDLPGQAFGYVLKHLRGEQFFVKRADPVIAEVYALAHKLELGRFANVIEQVLKSKKPERSPSSTSEATTQPVKEPSPPKEITIDPSLHASLVSALQRQRAKKAAKAGNDELESIRRHESHIKTEESWQHHWTSLVGG